MADKAAAAFQSIAQGRRDTVRTTIKDIAAKTGLSVTTVSLVLNNKPSKISQETRKLVLETARELCYRPNQLAVGLIKKRTKTFACKDYTKSLWKLFKSINKAIHITILSTSYF